MTRYMWILFAVLWAPVAFAEEAETDEENDVVAEAAAADEETVDDPVPVDPSAPKTLSGMSILGNEEAPKSLVIIPWKSSEIGSDLGLDDSLDERAEPVDREVFLRELEFFEIRAGK